MKRSNSKQKAQGAFKKLGAVALITATLAMCFTACKQTSGGGGGGKPTPTPTPKPKHAITFSVDSTTPNGKLKAKVEDIVETETSPINVEEGKTVTFTAEPSANYKVKEWKVGNTVVTGNTSNTYTHTVTKAVTVKVSFEAIPPTKYTITFTQTEHGKVTASPAIPADGKVAKDTEITFTAKADTGYKIGKWTVTGSVLEAGTGTDVIETAKVKITADTTISVSFEAIPKHAITFSVEGGNGTLKAKAYGVAETTTSPINVEEGKAVIFTATASDGYRLKGWTLDGNAVNGTAEAYTLAVTQAATVKVSFEEIPKEAILTLDPNYLTIRVKAKTADGSAITVEGCNETTLTSDVQTALTATGTKVILKGNITELNCNGSYYYKQSLTSLNVQGLTTLQKLECSYNELPELNVQGCTALKRLECWRNKLTELNVQGLTELQELLCQDNQLTTLNVQGLTALQELHCFYNNKLTSLNIQGCASLKILTCFSGQLNAEAMTEILKALPAREVGDNAKAVLYNDYTLEFEGNCKDYTKPAELKKAFEDAKKRNWGLKKANSSGHHIDI